MKEQFMCGNRVLKLESGINIGYEKSKSFVGVINRRSHGMYNFDMQQRDTAAQREHGVRRRPSQCAKQSSNHAQRSRLKWLSACSTGLVEDHRSEFARVRLKNVAGRAALIHVGTTVLHVVFAEPGSVLEGGFDVGISWPSTSRLYQWCHQHP